MANLLSLLTRAARSPSARAAGLTAAGQGLAALTEFLIGGEQNQEARQTSELLANPLEARVNDPSTW